MTGKLWLSWPIAAVIFGLLDFLWLKNMAPKLYRPHLGDLLAAEFRMAPALIFYVIYITGMVWFAIRPAMASGQWTAALLNGVLIGGLCYATYDLTNQATLARWSTTITLADIAWGMFATGTTAALTSWIMLRFVTAQ